MTQTDPRDALCHIALCTKTDAECDKQSTVDNTRDGRRAAAATFFEVQSLGHGS